MMTVEAHWMDEQTIGKGHSIQKYSVLARNVVVEAACLLRQTDC